jgi:hypothetical protein
MSIDKYKIELESAIYEGADGKFFIGGKIVEKVLNDYHNEQLNLPHVIKSVCGDCLYYLTCNHESRDKQICDNYDNEP